MLTIEPIKFTYTAYVEWIKRTKNVRDIAASLRYDCSNASPAAFMTMEELGFIVFTPDCWMTAANMIVNNKIIEI